MQPFVIIFTPFPTLQFRALSDQMYKSPEYHKHVRKEVVKQVEHLSSDKV